MALDEDGFCQSSWAWIDAQEVSVKPTKRRR